MASGGARAQSGPAPDPDALRRNRKDDAEWTTLPAAGRQGKPPAWPLSKATKRESQIWAEEWKRPQAMMWERNGQAIEVAMYVRTLIAAEKLGATQGMRNLVRQQQEALGLSLPGLARNHWRIEEVAEEGARNSAEAGKPAKAKSARDRFTVIDGDKT